MGKGKAVVRLNYIYSGYAHYRMQYTFGINDLCDTDYCRYCTTLTYRRNGPGSADRTIEVEDVGQDQIAGREFNSVSCWGCGRICLKACKRIAGNLPDP